MSKIQTEFKGGSRFYTDPTQGVSLPGVTSILGMLSKPFLQQWAAKMTAELAVDSLDYIGQMAERGGRESAVEFLKGASRRYTKERATVGSTAHDAFERMIRGEDVGRVHPDVVNHVRHFGEFLDTVQPELVRAEDVAWSDTHAYAGSFDAVLRLHLDPETLKPDPQGEAALIMADWKTSKSTYPEVALQMAAYAHADRIIDPDGDSEPMPEFDGGAVLHVTDTQWSFKPVRIDKADVFATFLALRQVFTWDREISKTVLGKPLAKSGRLVTGTQRRAR